MNNTKNFCVILAGGKGRRLWPCSRSEYPKQFIDFFGTGKTQLQQTFERMSKIIAQDHIYIITNEVYAYFVREQLPCLASKQILAEPIQRNSAPSIAWATHRIEFDCPNANIVIVPSDQMIFDEETFKKDICEGLDFVQQRETILTMGVKPTRPEPGYGYIQIGEYSNIDAIYGVKSFTEKPDRDFAQMFVDSGEWYWNTGMFLGTVNAIKKCLFQELPMVFRVFDKNSDLHTIEAEEVFVKEKFSSFPNISMDYVVLEKSDDVYVKKCSFGWGDLGTWHGVYEAEKQDEGDNVIIDSDVIFEKSHNNIIKLPKGRLAVINGLDGYIVAEHDNVLFICKKEDSSALVRKYVNEVQLKKGDAFV
ncbi:mannose-1-phosphate guanylyltransferase [Segatella bryantii]|uniref:mannose-1-phosphate guanylyltransferase n=1 Tax=Segatella bryantii TaxID=77095 RepID=UPI00242F2335|nr:sugar phosphate nucleotidyltransferase [Segatella bryantii]